MSIFITGASGLVGKELSKHFNSQDIHVQAIKRLKSNEIDSPTWNYQDLIKNTDESPDVVIQLAGENIASKRWSQAQKNKIYNSRVQGTKNLVEQILKSKSLPSAFICASAIGYYGDRGGETLTESSSAGHQFVSEICKDLEAETLPLKERGVRVINLRFGVILSSEGGSLNKILLPFKLGIGGKVGRGDQYFSWVSIKDVVKSLEFCIKTPKLNGPVNIVAPNPVTNEVFSKALAKSLNRPAIFPMPALMAKLAFGEMATELLLSGQKVYPQKLMDNGYEFAYPELDSALNSIIN